MEINLKDVKEATRIILYIAKEVVEDRGWVDSWTFGYKAEHPYLEEDLNDKNYNKAVFVKYENGRFFTKENPLDDNEEPKEIHSNGVEVMQELHDLEGEGDLFGFDVMIIRK